MNKMKMIEWWVREEIIPVRRSRENQGGPGTATNPGILASVMGRLNLVERTVSQPRLGPFPEGPGSIEDPDLAQMGKLWVGFAYSRKWKEVKVLARNVSVEQSNLRWGLPGIWPGSEDYPILGEHPYPTGLRSLQREVARKGGLLRHGLDIVSFTLANRSVCNCFCY